MIGDGWTQLAEELAADLASLTPPGELLRARVDQHGLLVFAVSLPRESRAAGHQLVRAYEQRAIMTCERCGQPGRIRSGAVLRILCDGCCD
jgi:hypothetical protein